MNKFGIALVVACLMALTAGTVSADPFSETKTWTPAIKFGGYGGYSYYSYTHDITDQVTLPGDTIDDATLTLEFSDDTDGAEYLCLALDSAWEWWYEEINTGSYPIDVLAQVQNDGKLFVQIWSGGGDVWLCSSTLSGNFTPVPVPGAVLLGVLGLGAAGMRLRKNKVA